MNYDGWDGVLSKAKTERLQEAHWFLGYIENRIRTADARLGDDAERAKKQLAQLGAMVHAEIRSIESGT